MELKLNREYAVRHLGVALLFAGLCGWFCYDGAVKYPQKDEAYFRETLHTEKNRAIARQFQFASITGVFALIVAFGVWRVKRQTLGWDDRAMKGSLTGGREFPFEDVAALDESRWKNKGILAVIGKDGRRMTLDAWHHVGVNELAERLGAGTEKKDGNG